MVLKQENGRVIFDVSLKDFDGLLFALGVAKRDGNDPQFWSLIALTNRINEGNPDYRPYEIPQEYMEKTT